MKNGKIHLYNLLILFGYMSILTILSGEGVIITSIVPIGLQIFVNLMLFVNNFKKNRSLSYSYLLSAHLVLLVGFPSCLGFSNFGQQFSH